MVEEESLRPIYHKKTKVQDLGLHIDENNGEIILTLDRFVQFREGEDERIYHYNLVDKAIELNPTAKTILILGGGDGLCSRNILRLLPKAIITLVDFDKEVVDFCRTHEKIVRLNEGSLEHCILIYEDAKTWVKNINIFKFDIIILDLPDGTSEELKQLYTTEFYTDVVKLLTENGIISIQTHPDIKDKVQNSINKLLKNSEVIVFKMPWLTEGAVVLGKHGKNNL